MAETEWTVEQFLTLKEAAALLRCSVDTLREHIRKGKIPARRLGGRGMILIARADLMAALTDARGDA